MTSNARTVRLSKAGGALLALAVVLVGVPAGLAKTVGWPLPRSLPRLHDITSSLGGQSIDDAFLVKTLALVCWLAWAQFGACVAAETVAWRRGRRSRRIPLSGALQPLVAQLVMTAALVLQVVPRPSLGSTVMIHAAATAKNREPAAPTAGTTAETGGAASNTPRRTYTVKPRDDLWTLAETHLGDAARWRELFELNRGRPQPKGGALRHSWLIRTGWVLQFPDDAVGLEEATAAAVAAPAPAAPAAMNPSDGDPSPAAFLPSTTGMACATPSGVDPLMPATPAPPTPGPAEAELQRAAPAEEDTPVGVVQETAAHEPDREAAHQSEGTEKPRSSKAPAGLLAAGLFAAGLVATLDRMRQAQRRRRRPGRMLRMPDPAAVPAEVAARRAATDSPAARLDLALRLFARRVTDRSATALPTVSAVQVAADGRIEILLTGALDTLPAPFTVDGGGQVWTLAPGIAHEDLADAGHHVGAPFPALVTVGRLSDTTVLIDLEAAGCTVLAGDGELAGTALRAMALELATSLWADTVDVIMVSSNTFPALDRLRVVPTIAEVLDDTAATAGALSDALARVGAPTTLAARVGDHAADGWIPTIVFCDNPSAEAEAFAELVALAADGGRGLAVVAVGDVAQAGRMIRFRDGTVEVTPPGVVLDPVGPTQPQLAAVEEILTAAADAEGVEAGADPTVASPDTVEEGSDLETPSTGDIDVLVRLLGPVEIEGAKHPIDRARAVELVVYLATHPSGVNDERLKTALWPDDRAPQSSFNTTVTRARSRLGTDTDGAPHLPHLVATGGLYRLGPRVTTDVAVLERILVAARNSTPEAARRTLKSGLELVRGAPFTGVRQGYEWAHAEGLVSRMEVVVAEAAHMLAQLAIDTRDANLAQWAACQGLLASPGDEVLYRDRMLAFDLAGNPAGVEAVMDELVAVAEAVEPYDTLHPETIALYTRLSHRRRRTG